MGKGNPHEVGDTRLDVAMLSLWGRSLTPCYSSKNENFGLIFEIWIKKRDSLNIELDLNDRTFCCWT